MTQSSGSGGGGIRQTLGGGGGVQQTLSGGGGSLVQSIQTPSSFAGCGNGGAITAYTFSGPAQITINGVRYIRGPIYAIGTGCVYHVGVLFLPLSLYLFRRTYIIIAL